MKNHHLNSFLLRAQSNSMAIGKIEADNVQALVRAKLSSSWVTLFDSKIGAGIWLAWILFTVSIPSLFMVVIGLNWAFDPVAFEKVNVANAWFLPVVFFLGLTGCRLNQMLGANVQLFKRVDDMLSLVSDSPIHRQELLDLCDVSSQAERMRMEILRQGQSCQVMHLNAMRQMDTQNLAAQKAANRDAKAEDQAEKQRLAECQMMQSLMT